jgi:guanylate kinase
MKKKGVLLVVSGPSGAGKGTLCKALRQRHPEIVISISATTRSPRHLEEEGVNYFFITKEAFEDRIEQDQFLEHACVYDNYYGTPKKFVIDHLMEGTDVLLEIDIQGALQVRKKYPEGVFIFVLPPSMKELKSRIVGRGSETKESLEKRFSSAYEEIDYVKKYDYYIINDTVEEAVQKFESIISAEKSRVFREIEELITEFKEEQPC